MTNRWSYFKAAMMMPAHWLAWLAGGVASLAVKDWTPLFAAGAGSFAYLGFLSMLPSFRRAVRANLLAQDSLDVLSDLQIEALLSELGQSQKQHYWGLKELRDKILSSYDKLPGGRVMAASSERRLDALLTAFLRLLGTLNSYRKYLSSADRKGLEDELLALENEVEVETSARLKEVKARRADILRKRVQRFAQAAESREVISHQLASIEDLLRLTHEQSIAIRDPEVVGRQLEALTVEVEATEETVREMEKFMELSEELHGAPSHTHKVRS